MLDSILNTLQSSVAGDLQSKAGLSSDKINDVIKLVGSVASKEVGGAMSGGNLSAVMNLFSKQPNNAAAGNLQEQIGSNLVSGLVSRLGFDQQKAGLISSIVVPALINLIAQKNSATPDNDASPLQNIFGNKGDAIGNAGKVLGGLFGKK